MLYCSGETERTRRMAAETSRGTATETSVGLKLMQQLGIETTDWNRVNEFCNNPRIAGKPLVQVSTAELEQLAIKLGLSNEKEV